MTQSPITVLLVNGQAADLQRSREMLGSGDLPAAAGFRPIVSRSVTDALATIARESVDVVLLDLALGDGGGLDEVRRLRDAAPQVPIVLAVSPATEALAFEGVQAGAQDYVVKGLDDGRVIRRAIRHAVERAARARGRDALLFREHDARLAAEEARADADRARAAAEALERRATFLADAGASLAATLDARVTLATATRLAVPMLGDCAIGFIVKEDGVLEPVETVGHDHGLCCRHPQEEHHRSEVPADARCRGVEAARALASGSDMATLLSQAERDGDPVLRGPDAAGAAQRTGRAAQVVAAEHWMLVPLRARDRVLGVLALVACGATRKYDPADLQLADAFATRAAVAMDNARLYETSRRAIRTRDQVLGIVSHDLRNPLGAIGMCAVALRNDEGLPPRDRERLITTIRDSVDWTKRLLGDLLDIASIEAGRLSVAVRPIDPVMVIGRALDLFELTAGEHSLRVADDVPDVVPSIMGDPQRILQVLANLISNAVKFTPPGGAITLGVTPGGGFATFTVSDSGPGIAPQHAEHIFDWFWRASHERAERGTGLGLAIARGIVEAHGGRIWVSSLPGEGTTISFTIPLVAEPEPRPRAALRRRREPVNA